MDATTSADAAKAVSANALPLSAGRHCSECPNPITRHSKTGRCRVCALKLTNSDPATAARRAAGIIARFASDPDLREKHRKACKESAARRMAEDPAFAERLRKNGRESGRWNFWKMVTPEAREKARRNIQRAHLAWCPEEHWALNEKLKRCGYRLPERKRMILEQVPGTIEHARRAIANIDTAQRIRHADEQARIRREAY